MPEINCDICGVKYSNKKDFREHSWSLMHHIKKEHKEGKSSHVCPLCKKSYSNLAEYGRHLNEIEHKNNVEDDRRARSPDSTQKSGSSNEGEQHRSRKDGRYAQGKSGNLSKSILKGDSKPPLKNRAWTSGSQSPNRKGNNFNKQPNYFVPDSQYDSDRSYNQPRRVPFWQDNINFGGQSGWPDFSRPPPPFHQGGYHPGYHSSYGGMPWKENNSNYYGNKAFQQGSSTYNSNNNQQYDKSGNSSWEKWDRNVSSSQSISKDTKGNANSSSSIQSKSTSVDEGAVAKEDTLSNKASKLIDDILSGKPISKSTDKEKETDKIKSGHEQLSDPGTDILKKAERMCKDLRKEREAAKKKSTERAKAKQKAERKKLDNKIEGLSQASLSMVSGILEGSRLSDPPSGVETKSSSSEKSSVYSSVSSMYRASYATAGQVSKASLVPSTTLSASSISGKASESNHSTGTTSTVSRVPNTAQKGVDISSGTNHRVSKIPTKTHKHINPSSRATSTVPKVPTTAQKDTRHKMSAAPGGSKITKKSGEVEKDNLVKLVAPRSRKEWNDLKKILHTYKKKWSRPRLNLIDKYDDQIRQCGDSGEMEMDDLPKDIQDQICQLLDDVMSDYSAVDSSSHANYEYDCNVITITPEDPDVEIVHDSYAVPSGRDGPFRSMQPNHTSTPADTPADNRHKSMRGEGTMSWQSANHTELFNDCNSTTSNYGPSTVNTSYGSPALDEYAKQIDAEIANIASVHSATSMPDSYNSTLLGAKFEMSHAVHDGNPFHNSEQMEPDTNHSVGEYMLQSVTPGGTGVPEPLYIVRNPANQSATASTVKTEKIETCGCTPELHVFEEGLDVDSSARLASAKRRRETKLETPSPVEPAEKQQPKRPKMDKKDARVVVLSDSDESMTEQSAVDDTPCTMEGVYELSLKEEEIRAKIGETSQEITDLEKILENTRQQLQKKKEVQTQLQIEEEKLRSKRLKILKGAVTEKKNSSKVSNVTQSEPDSTVIQVENSPDSVKIESPPASDQSASDRQCGPPETTPEDQAQDHMGLQYIGTLDATGLDPSQVKQLAACYSNDTKNSAYVFLEESQFQKCLSDSTVSQESDEEVEKTPARSDDGVFKKPNPVSDTRNARGIKHEHDDESSSKPQKSVLKNPIKTEEGEDVKGKASKMPAVKSSSMSNLDTITEERSESGSKGNHSSPARGSKKEGKADTQKAEPEKESKHKSKKKKKPKETKPALLDSSSDSVICKEPKKGKRTQDPEAQKILREYLHASSSSDVSMEGLNVASSPLSVRKKKKSSRKNQVSTPSAPSEGSDVSSRSLSSDNEFMGMFPTGHAGAVRFIIPIGKQGTLITGGADHSLKEFQSQSAELKSSFYGHKAEVTCAVVVPEHNKRPITLYTGSSDNMLITFNLKTGKQIAKHRYADRVCSLAYLQSAVRHDCVFIGLGNGSVVTSNPTSGANIDAYKHSSGPINCLATSREGPRNILCVAGQDCSIGVRDANNSLLLRSLEGHIKPPVALKILNNLVFSGGPDGMVQIHNLNTGEMQRMIRMQDNITSLGLTSNGKDLLVAGNLGVISCFNTQSYTQDRIYYSHGKVGVTAIAVKRKHWVYVGTKDGSIECIKMRRDSWTCKFGRCKLVCGRKEDLQYHVMHDHVSAMNQTGGGCCLWNNCSESISMKDDELGTVRHIAAHIGS